MPLKNAWEWIADMRKVKPGLSFIGKMLCLCSFLFLTFAGQASRKASPLAFEEVAQVWIGISELTQYMLRLDLSSDGKGTGAYIYFNSEPRPFFVSAWTYSNGKLHIELEQSLGSSPLGGELTGFFEGSTMRLRATGDDWEIHFFLRQEEPLIEKIERLKESTPAGPSRRPTQ